MKRLDELSLKLLDENIDEDELQELMELTQSPDGREVLLRLCELESHLASHGRSSITDNVMAQIQEERCDRVTEGVMQVVRELPEPTRSSLAGRSKFRIPALVIGIAAMAACLVLVVLQNQKSEETNEVIATLNPRGSLVKMFDADGRALPLPQAEQPFLLRQNQTIETSQAIDSAEIVYADGTTIELLGETKAILSETSNGSKQLEILTGLIHADVSPQPRGRPLQIITRTATLEVLGTTLGVEVRAASTQLGVATGLVAMTRKVDGQRVEVEGGRYATATKSASEPFQTHPFPELPTEWSEDFEDGLPSGWRTGEFVDGQDTKAVRAVKSWRSDDGRFVVTSQNEWQEGKHGFCSIDETSVLHMRIRQSKFARITIMVGTRSYPPATGRVGRNLFYTKKAWNEDLLPETWKTISVPLRDVAWYMKQGTKESGAPELEGLAAYLIHVTTMEHDAELLVDRIWITSQSEGSQR